MIAEAPVENIGAAHSPLTKLVVNSIRDRILKGDFAPGERLVEAHLSTELGVSRMPVREALRELAAEGFVVIEPRRGASVTVYTPEQIQELVEVRATLESLNAKLAAKRQRPDQIARLEKILAAGSRLTEHTDLAHLHDANNDFHEALAQVAANATLRDMIRSLRERTAVIFAPNSRKRARENWQEHAAIVRAVVAGDADLAGLLAARHVYNAAAAISQVEQMGEDSGASADRKKLKRASA